MIEGDFRAACKKVADVDQCDCPAVKAMAASQDFIEGPKAFSEKRAPNWQGK